MEYYCTWVDVLQQIKSDTSINFVARATTPWNAISIDALILKLQALGIRVNAIIAIDEHPLAGFMIREKSFVNKVSCYCFLRCKKEKSTEENRYINEQCMVNGFRHTAKVVFGNSSYDNILYFATYNANTPDAILAVQYEFLKRKIVICRTEEGVGAYMGTFDKTYQGLRNISTLGDLKGYILTILLGKYVYRLFHKGYNSLTLKDSIRGLVVDESNLQYYLEVFQQQLSDLYICLDKDMISKSVLVCTTAWRRDEIKDDEDFRILKQVCDELHNRGFKLLLKTHPRDSYFKTRVDDLHCTHLEVENISMETIISCAKPLAMISFSSTTLVNAKIFGKVPVYCLSDMLDRSKISSFYLDEIDSFKRTFKHIVRFITSAEDIGFNEGIQ